MDVCESLRLGNIMFWDEYDVHCWFSGLGLPQYEEQIREHHITGDILIQLNVESLKELGVVTIGQRLRVLKAVYEIKVAQGMGLEPGDYIPPSELDLSYDYTCSIEGAVVTQIPSAGAARNHRRCSDSWSEALLRDLVIPTSVTNFSPTSAPLSSATSAGLPRRYSFERSKQAQANSPIILAEDTKGKARIDDPVWKVLPVALKNRKITEDWRNYDMIICYEDKELLLAHDDKPGRILQRLREENKNPVLMLKYTSNMQIYNNSFSPPPLENIHAGVTYGVAIHPYRSRKGVLINVLPGDTFIVLSKGKGRWIVQRDYAGTGIMNNEQESIRIPPGCVLETDIPVAFASAAALAARAPEKQSSVHSPTASNKPILPCNILSHGYATVALVNYHKTIEDGIDVSRGEPIYVYKLYRNSAYLVKEDGERGWAPTSLIDKKCRAGTHYLPVLPSLD